MRTKCEHFDNVRHKISKNIFPTQEDTMICLWLFIIFVKVLCLLWYPCPYKNFVIWIRFISEEWYRLTHYGLESTYYSLFVHFILFDFLSNSLLRSKYPCLLCSYIMLNMSLWSILSVCKAFKTYHKLHKETVFEWLIWNGYIIFAHIIVFLVCMCIIFFLEHINKPKPFFPSHLS